MKDKITIRKIAEELSLSPATVYRALSGYSNVRMETRRKVLQSAQKKGYMLPEHKNNNIAILVPYFRFSGYPEYLLRCLETEFHNRGFRLEMIPHQDIDFLRDYMFDGIISLIWKKGLEKKLPQRFAVPIITINAPSNMLESVPVIMSDPHGIRQALNYLRCRGCRKIAFVSPPAEISPTDAAARIDEFRKFCMETGQDFDALFFGSLFPEKVVPLILKQNPDACFCASEEYAARIGLQFKKAGLRIPEDISLMGLETSLLNECFTPPITAIRQDFEQIAEVTAESMYQAIVNRIPPTCAAIPFQLIERESVRKPDKTIFSNTRP